MGFTFSPSDFIPFRDRAQLERVRHIPRERICEHRNPAFRIRVIEEPERFYFEFALDIVDRIRRALEEGRRFVGIFPVGPTPQYDIAAALINRFRISMHHVHWFNMDEYADENGRTAPREWDASFQRAMYDNFFSRLDPELRPPESQIHFPSSDNIACYAEAIEALGGADVCYGGIGWCGHIAFWEAHLGIEFGDDIEAFLSAGPRIVTLHPMTIMQNALHSFGGDWSWVPPKAATIGPAQVARARHRSFWLDGYLGGGVSWQRFIARLVAHGPVTPLVPGSVLQRLGADFTLLGGVADDVRVVMR